MIKYLALTLLSVSFSFAHATDSSAVPTNALEANFSISPSDDGTMAVGTVDFYQVGAVNGVLQEQSVNFNETLTFTVNGTTVTYDSAKAEADMPLAPNTTYTLNFTRANGETYTSTVTMPDLAKFSSPTPAQVFQAADAVTAAWANVQSDMTLAAYSPSCGTVQGDPSFNDAFTQATFPANYAASCTGTTTVNFELVNANAGTGFGTFTAMSVAPISWNYGSPTTVRAHHIDRHFLNNKLASLHRMKKSNSHMRIRAKL